jgi:hypothetical protein
LQLDKFTPQQAREVSDQARHIAPLCTLALTGGMTSPAFVSTSIVELNCLLLRRRGMRHRLIFRFD